jgi:hypothetical protein
MSTQLAELDRHYAAFREGILELLHKDVAAFNATVRELDRYNDDKSNPVPIRMATSFTSMMLRIILLENRDRLPEDMQIVFHLVDKIKAQQPSMTTKQILELIADMDPEDRHFDGPPRP